jgi:putative oxidoreductase
MGYSAVWKRWDNRWVELACRLLVGGVFAYASLDKILHPAQFAKVVYNYQLLPVPLSNLFAVILPWLELFAGLALLVGVLRTESALILSGLLVVFIVALSVNVYRGVDVDCGCMSLTGGRTIGILTVVEDVVLLVAALVVLRRSIAEEVVSVRS